MDFCTGKKPPVPPALHARCVGEACACATTASDKRATVDHERGAAAAGKAAAAAQAHADMSTPKDEFNELMTRETCNGESVGLSPFCPSRTNDVNVSVATSLHQCVPLSGRVHHLSSPDTLCLTQNTFKITEYKQKLVTIITHMHIHIQIHSRIRSHIEHTKNSNPSKKNSAATKFEFESPN